MGQSGSVFKFHGNNNNNNNNTTTTNNNTNIRNCKQLIEGSKKRFLLFDEVFFAMVIQVFAHNVLSYLTFKGMCRIIQMAQRHKANDVARFRNISNLH